MIGVTTTLTNLASKIDGMQIARERHRVANESKPPQRPTVARVIPKPTNADEARELRLQLVDRRNPHEILSELHDEQFRLSQQITDLEAILKDNPTEQERRDIEGYQTKVLPSLPGIADTYVHVPGSLERATEKVSQIERDIPRVTALAADYDALVEAVKDWPWARINEERNKENERRLISKGKPVQKRGPQARSVEFVPKETA